MARKHLPAVALAVLAASLAVVVGGGSALAQPPVPYLGDYKVYANDSSRLDLFDLAFFTRLYAAAKAGAGLATQVTYIDQTRTVGFVDFNGDGVVNRLDADLILLEYLKPYSQVKVKTTWNQS